MKSYKDLDVYKEAYNLAIEVHNLTMKLPKYELFEQEAKLDALQKV